MRILRTTLLAGAAMALTAGVAAADGIFIGNLYDFTGATSAVGKFAGQGKIDALAYINAHGGINGKKMEVDNYDYSYKAPQAIAAYKKWKQKGVTVVQGWGTADTEALVGFVGKDQIPYMSMSFSGHLTDPMGKGPKTKAATPYNFFAAPSYSDGARALLQWAKADWEKKGGQGAPKYVHMGDNHPYPNAPKEAGETYAKELGFEVGQPIQYSLRGGDFKAQCLSLKDSGANYAFLGNTTGSNIALLKSCATVGVDTQFMANIWGMDENGMKAAGKAADGVTWVMSNPSWNDEAPGMKTMREVSKMSDPTGKEYRPVHYIRAACSIFYMKEALEWADKNGGITGPNVKKALESRTDWVPAGLEGVCGPVTWTPEDHRAQIDIPIYQAVVSGDTTQDDMAMLIEKGTIGMKRVFDANIPRRPEWLGW
ncbi:MAG: ABC transporter substrate-binding protein [Alphaproteobacteria bacterium]